MMEACRTLLQLSRFVNSTSFTRAWFRCFSGFWFQLSPELSLHLPSLSQKLPINFLAVFCKVYPTHSNFSQKLLINFPHSFLQNLPNTFLRVGFQNFWRPAIFEVFGLIFWKMCFLNFQFYEIVQIILQDKELKLVLIVFSFNFLIHKLVQNDP